MADSISRDELEARLKKLTRVRAIVTFLVYFVGLASLFLLNPDGARRYGFVAAAPAAVVFGLMTWLYCRPGVLCPFCGGSLWNCGTPSFKDRDKRLWKRTFACPHCDLPIK